jgi:hypothetical protein
VAVDGIYEITLSTACECPRLRKTFSPLGFFFMLSQTPFIIPLVYLALRFTIILKYVNSIDRVHFIWLE